MRESDKRSVVHWAENNFYIEETEAIVQLAPYQRAVLAYCLRRGPEGRFPFDTIIWSQPKKTGKTTISGMVIGWAAETWGRFGEILCIGNDADQARERGYAKMTQSVMMHPGWDQRRRMLPGQWLIGTKQSRHVPSGTNVKAIATDYKGEAGANPVLSVWTELWGFAHRADLRFWAEMAPSPIRSTSIRWIETYAGYDGESELLYGLYEQTVKNGRQLTAGELQTDDPNVPDVLGAFEEAPNPDDPIPCYVNEAARMFAFCDEAPNAHRMPWQRNERGEEYYRSEAATQTPQQYTRLHGNQWVSAESSFIQIGWWDVLNNPFVLGNGDPMPLVIGLDAAVTGDCFGLVAVSRDPDRPADGEPGIAVRFVQKWDPPQGGAINYDRPREIVKWLIENFNVVEVAYDPTQLHDFCTSLMRDTGVWFNPYSQGQERLISDALLYRLIVERRVRHDGNVDLRQHLTNANAKLPSGEDNRMRLVKKSESRKIDLAVSLAMAARECLRLAL